MSNINNIVLREQPYKKLDYFKSEDAGNFFGRERETAEISALIQSHRLVLLYGASGAGKTSLLLAGVKPHLEQPNQAYKVIYIRSLGSSPRETILQNIQREFEFGRPPDEKEEPIPINLGELRKLIVESFDTEEIINIGFDLDIRPDELSGDSNDTKARKLISHCERRDRLEELITICKQKRPTKKWPLQENKAETKIDEKEFVNFLRNKTRNSNTTLVLILDQFEEFFKQINPEARAEFINQLGELYNQPLIPVHVVLSLREDWLAPLNEFKKANIPIFAIYERLSPLSPEQARRAIIEPLDKLDICYDTDLVDRLLTDLVEQDKNNNSQQYVHPAQLQLVCSTLYRNTLDNNQKTISLAAYEALGGVQGILGHYLEHEMSLLTDSERGLAKLVFEELVSSERTKRMATSDQLAHAIDVAEEELHPVLDSLVLAHLLRSFKHLEQNYYELVHDYLAQEITLAPEVIARKAVEELVAQELRNWKSFGLWISPDRLNTILPWRESLKLSPEAKELIDESLRKKGLDEEQQLEIIQSDKLTFLNRLVVGIDKEIIPPVTSITANSNILYGSVGKIRKILDQIADVLAAQPETSGQTSLRQHHEALAAQIEEILDGRPLSRALNEITDISGELEMATQKMAGVIKAISNFSQTENAPRQILDIHSTLDDALLLLGHQLLQYGVEVRKKYVDFTPQVQASPNQLVQLFINILIGSVEALKTSDDSDFDGKIHLATNHESRQVIITISHQGLGFQQRHLLDGLFEMAQPETAEKNHSTLMLSTASLIIQRHKGAIEIENSPDRQTRIIIKLPLFDPAAEVSG